MPGARDTAFAVDVGTTTVVVLLVDLVTGEVLSRAGAFNEQIRFGDNVITRIDAAHKPENLAAMQRAIVMETIQPLLLRACQRAGRTLERIAGGAIAGNTTMLHLLAGEDPTSLGIAPFTPRFIEGQRSPGPRHPVWPPTGLAPETPLQLLPGIAAYIGADITAGILASGMAFDPAPSLLVDIGTNGEIVLQSGGKLTACATAAGPAFEGCGLRCGTRRARRAPSATCGLTLHPFATRNRRPSATCRCIGPTDCAVRLTWIFSPRRAAAACSRRNGTIHCLRLGKPAGPKPPHRRWRAGLAPERE